MSHFSRKDFLRLTSWSIVATLIPVEKISAITSAFSNTKESLNSDFQTALDFAKDAKSKFLLKDYVTAESKYLQAITLAPAYIQFYDGLDNVFGAQNKYLESIELYKNGLLQNPAKVVFYDRAARSLLRIQTGNRRLALQYKTEINSEYLLADAVSLYQSALAIDSSKQYLHIGLNKVNAKINIAPLEDNYKVNRVFKNLKTQNRNNYNSLLNGKTNAEIMNLIDRVDSKVRRELFKPEEIEERKINMMLQKKKYYHILQKRLNINDVEKKIISEKLFEVDYKDPSSINKVKVAYYYNNLYFAFIEVKKKFSDSIKTVHGYIGLMDAMELAYKPNQADIQTLDDAISIGFDLLDNWSLVDQNYVEVVIKTTKILLLKSDYVQAKVLLESAINKLKIESTSINNKLIHYYAKINFHEGKFLEAKRILLVGINEKDDDTESKIREGDTSLMLVEKLFKLKKTNRFRDNLSLFYLLYDTYFVLEDTANSIGIINRLIANNPQDSFVLTRS